ncbi:unnamed protein product (macronuclear) [Paramecium tetraurelia]|uniref:CRC domain-containing protein n=1 Tax=Paramecium tetraurelia TaxID=5888 RepID=A0CVA4_PARTE|nr:uncharacterized protein GSPATT00010889001 [Paramecium tetraurelia]CAK74721.1 unnamed protein product [Paramecium tetraurelia]|eukprot:XP_001442118.1 hypothetical protein (macronuclear) [Paramecium tetraurelia strain d4-2]
MARDYQFKQPSFLRVSSIVSQIEEPYKSPQLQKFASQLEDIANEYEYRPLPLSRQASNFILYDPINSLGSRRSITKDSYPLPFQKQQSQISQINDIRVKEELSKEIEQEQKEQPNLDEDKDNNKIKKSQQVIKTSQIQKQIKKKKNELEQQPCFCRNSGCLKRYCRCFHSGRMCLKECQCVEGCLNNEDHLEERNMAIKHVNEKCHRNKNIPKDALFKLKDCFGCSCKKSRCQTGYCECFLRKSKCTIDCECQNCENGLDEAYLESQKNKKNYRVKRK